MKYYLALLLVLCGFFCSPCFANPVRVKVLNEHKPFKDAEKVYAWTIERRIEGEWLPLIENVQLRTPKTSLRFTIKPSGEIDLSGLEKFDPDDPNNSVCAASAVLEYIHDFTEPPGGNQLVCLLELDCRRPNELPPPSPGAGPGNFLRAISLMASLALNIYGATNTDVDYVNGYSRSDGSFVQGHWRSARNGTMFDNFSSLGNINPYTNRRGTIRPTH